MGWVDNRHLLIGARGQGIDGLDGLLVLNPFDHTREEFRTTFSDIWTIEPFPDWEGFSLSLTVPDPTLRYTVHASFPQSDGEEGVVLLWDTQTQEEVAHIFGTAFFGKTPKWSPDGKAFVTNSTLTMSFPIHSDVGLDQELFSIDTSGKITRLTFLTEYFEEVNFGQYSWSPTGESIAFWAEMTPTTYPVIYPDPADFPYQRIAVVDVATRNTVNYCVPGDQYNWSAVPPIWSGDGKHIFIENRFSETESRIYMLSLESGAAYQIAEDLIPVGWLAAE